VDFGQAVKYDATVPNLGEEVNPNLEDLQNETCEELDDMKPRYLPVSQPIYTKTFGRRYQK